MLDLVLARCYLSIGRPLTASVEPVDEGAIVRLEGRLSSGSGDALRDLVLAGLRRGNRQFVFDLKGVSYIDGGGFRELVAACSAAGQRGAVVRLRSVSAKVFSLFEMVELRQRFDVLDEAEAAPAALVEEVV